MPGFVPIICLSKSHENLVPFSDQNLIIISILWNFLSNHMAHIHQKTKVAPRCESHKAKMLVVISAPALATHLQKPQDTHYANLCLIKIANGCGSQNFRAFCWFVNSNVIVDVKYFPPLPPPFEILGNPRVSRSQRNTCHGQTRQARTTGQSSATKYSSLLGRAA